MDVSFPSDQVSSANDPSGRARDHCRVVSAIGERWIRNRHIRSAQREDFLSKSLSEQRVGRDPPGKNDRTGIEFERGSCRLDSQRLDDCFLEAGGKVGKREAGSVDGRMVSPKRTRGVR
jgi:hypothetical protein